MAHTLIDIEVGFADAARRVTPAPGEVSGARRADKCPLGEFEHQVMVAVNHCEPEAYGVRICEHMLELYGTSLALAQVYVTLNRLERKGFLSSSWTDPKPTRGGRARRCYRLEGKGVTALDKSTAIRHRALSTSTSPVEVADDAIPKRKAGLLPVGA